MADQEFHQRLAKAKEELQILSQDVLHLEKIIVRHARGEADESIIRIANDNFVGGDMPMASILAQAEEYYWGTYASTMVQIAVDKVQTIISQIDIMQGLQKWGVNQVVSELELPMREEFIGSAYPWIYEQLGNYRQHGLEIKQIDYDILNDAADIMAHFDRSDIMPSFETKEYLLRALDEQKLKTIELSVEQLTARINMAVLTLDVHIGYGEMDIEEFYPYMNLDFVAGTLPLAREQIVTAWNIVREIDSRIPGRYTDSITPAMPLDFTI